MLAEGHSVLAVDIETDKIIEFQNDPGLTVMRNDIRAPGAGLVIDLIAYANPGLYIRTPLEVFRLNFMENLKIAESCVRHKKCLIQLRPHSREHRRRENPGSRRSETRHVPRGHKRVHPRTSEQNIAGSTPERSNCSSACPERHHQQHEPQPGI